MEIILNNERIIDQEIFSILNNHPEILGISQLEIKEIKSRLDNNDPPLLMGEVNQCEKECYDLFESEHYIGNIILCNYSDYWEIDIFIFSAFRGNRLMKKAIETLLVNRGNREYGAIILDSNPNKDKIIANLQELGFINGEIIPNKSGIMTYEYIYLGDATNSNLPNPNSIE